MLLVLKYRPEWLGVREQRLGMGYQGVQAQRRIAGEEEVEGEGEGEGEGETEVGGRYLDEPGREEQVEGWEGSEGRALVHAQATG